MRRLSRLVTTMEAAGHSRTRVSASLAAASTTCSQLSRTRRSFFSPIARATDSGKIGSQLGFSPRTRAFEGDVEVQQALAAGACGYLLKSTRREELIEVIRKIHSGRKHLPSAIAENLAEYFGSDSLSEREVDVLKCMAEGDRIRTLGGGFAF